MKSIEPLYFWRRYGCLVYELRIERLPSSIVRETDFRGSSRCPAQRICKFQIVDVSALPVIQYDRIVRIEDG